VVAVLCNTTKTQFCSVKQVDLSDLAETSNGNDNVSSGSSKHYTWKHLLRGYRQRLETHPDIDLSDVTVYVYAAKYHSGQEVAPWFAGFNAKLKWPLEEDFSKTMLMLHHPWTDVVEETKHGANTFAECLENYFWHEKFPRHIANETYKRKTKWIYDSAVGAEFLIMTVMLPTAHLLTNETMRPTNRQLTWPSMPTKLDTTMKRRVMHTCWRRTF
jgi:hypothetical protein